MFKFLFKKGKFLKKIMELYFIKASKCVQIVNVSSHWDGGIIVFFNNWAYYTHTHTHTHKNKSQDERESNH